MVYQGFDEDAILLKRKLTLDVAEKTPLWKLFSVKSRVCPCIFITNRIQFRGFPHWFYKITPFKISESFL